MAVWDVAEAASIERLLDGEVRDGLTELADRWGTEVLQDRMDRQMDSRTEEFCFESSGRGHFITLDDPNNNPFHERVSVQ